MSNDLLSEGAPANAGGVAAAAPVVPSSASDLDGSFVRSVAWTGAVKWSTQVLTWLSTIVVARLLTPDDYGLIGMATVFLGVVTLVSEFGLSITVVTLRDLTEEQLAQLNTVAVMIGGVAFALACAAALPLARFFRAPQLTPVVLVMSLAFLITSFRTVPAALLQKELRFKLLALLEGSQSVVVALSMVALALLGMSYWTLALGGVIGAAVLTVLTLGFRSHAFAWPALDTIRRPLRFTRHQLVGNLTWYAYANADFLIAGKLLGKTQLGIYTFAWSLAMTIPEKVTGLINRVTPAYLSAFQNDPHALRRYLVRVTETLSMVTFPALLGLAVVAGDLVLLALGEQWRGVIVPLQILSVYAAYDSVIRLFSRVLTVTGDTAFLMRVGVFLVVLMPIAFIVGSQWGPAGIAAAWIIAHPFSRVPIFRRVQQRIHIPARTYLKAYWPAVSSSVVMVAAVLLVRYTVAEQWALAPRLAAQVVCGVAAYGLMLISFHRERVAALVRVARSARG